MAASPVPAFRIKPLGNRLRNVLLSSGLCVALIAAYYMAIGNETVPPDTHVVFIEAGHRIDVAADGRATVATSGAADVMRQLTRPQMRHLLRAFRHENFLELDVAKFAPRPGDDACTLGLTLDHRKTVIRYGCRHPPAEVAGPLKGLAHEIQTARRY
jgi:hypothetical protein